ncbi:putative transcription factor MYB-HB-like family [Lupinus albus]|uniref:Putative transcription factor MYB-HB-like family n=1 Tax=Lupinus albus TaxID=3870 RepID=A0A6A4QE09_LUPAL|nr:putative transcription factor MYB-HB-like family [Lupinus albus]
MDFDPSFLYQLSDISMIFPEHTRNSEIPIMVPLQQTSTLVPPPPKNIYFYSQDNFHHSQSNHPFNGEYHDPCFVKKSPSSSSINPLSMIQTLSLGNSCSNWSHKNLVNPNYPIGFAPSNEKMEVSQEYLINNCNRFLDIPQEIPILYDAISQPLMGLSLASPHDAYAPVGVNPRLQDELSHIARAENVHQDTNHKIVVGDNKEQKITNKVKGKWTPDEDRILVESVRRFGLKKWSRIAKMLNGRVGKQCRERWFNHLRPNIRVISFSFLISY